MNFFRFDIRKFIIFALILILPIISISFLKPGDEFWIFRPVSSVIGMSQMVFLGFSNKIRETTNQYLNLISINQMNRELKDDNANLKAQVLSVTELQKENERLNEILQFQKNPRVDLLPAQVIGFDLMAERSSIRINRGTENGVKKGQAVMTKDAAVGYILKAHKYTSIVLVLTDRYAVIDAIVQTSRARGVVEGSGPDSCILKYLLRSDGMNPGDLVVTSGLDNIFPRGLPIARVKSIHRLKADISPQVDLIPIVDVTRLDELYVVRLVRSQPPDEAQLRAEEEARIEEEKLLEIENKKSGKKSPTAKKVEVKPATSPAPSPSPAKKPGAQ